MFAQVLLQKEVETKAVVHTCQHIWPFYCQMVLKRVRRRKPAAVFLAFLYQKGTPTVLAISYLCFCSCPLSFSAECVCSSSLAKGIWGKSCCAHLSAYLAFLLPDGAFRRRKAATVFLALLYQKGAPTVLAISYLRFCSCPLSFSAECVCSSSLAKGSWGESCCAHLSAYLAFLLPDGA